MSDVGGRQQRESSAPVQKHSESRTLLARVCRGTHATFRFAHFLGHVHDCGFSSQEKEYILREARQSFLENKAVTDEKSRQALVRPSTTLFRRLQFSFFPRSCRQKHALHLQIREAEERLEYTLHYRNACLYITGMGSSLGCFV